MLTIFFISTVSRLSSKLSTFLLILKKKLHIENSLFFKLYFFLFIFLLLLLYLNSTFFFIIVNCLSFIFSTVVNKNLFELVNCSLVESLIQNVSLFF